MVFFEADYKNVKAEYNTPEKKDAVLKAFQDETGIVLSVLPTIERDAINKIISGDNCSEQTLKVLHEEVIFKNMSEEEKVSKLVKYIRKIGAVDGELIIIDPYIFPKNNDDDYEKLIVNTIQAAKLSKLTIVTSKTNTNTTLQENVKKQVSCDITIKYSDDFHDRFWISRDTAKGFIVGTSLNGIGKKICIIKLLTDETDESDINEIIKMVDAIPDK